MKGGISASVAGQAFIATEAVAGHMIRHMPLSSGLITLLSAGAEVLEALDCASIPFRGGIGLGITVWFRRFAMVSRLWHGTGHRYQVLWCSVSGSGGMEHQSPSVAEPVPQRGGLPVVISIVNSLVAPMGGVTVGGRILSGRQPRANSVNLAKRSSRMNRLSMLS